MKSLKRDIYVLQGTAITSLPLSRLYYSRWTVEGLEHSLTDFLVPAHKYSLNISWKNEGNVKLHKVTLCSFLHWSKEMWWGSLFSS